VLKEENMLLVQKIYHEFKVRLTVEWNGPKKWVAMNKNVKDCEAAGKKRRDFGIFL
jgi:hypothetical protein